MQQLYPGWRQGSRKKYVGADDVQRIRNIQDLSIKDCVRIFYGYDQLIEPLWRQVQQTKCKRHLEPRDKISFIMVVSYLGFYGCSARAYYANEKDMYKTLSSEWGLSKEKFFAAILDAFKAREQCNRRFLNKLQANTRRLPICKRQSKPSMCSTN